MKSLKLAVALVFGLVGLAGAAQQLTVYAAKKSAFFVEPAIGAVQTHNDDVGPAPVMKADLGWNLGNYVSLGASVGQTGTFIQKEASTAAGGGSGASFGGFGSPHYHHDHDVTVNNDPTIIVNVHQPGVPATVPRASNLNERDYWFLEPYIELGAYVGRFRPYARGFFGGAGMRTQDEESRVGSSYGYGGGLLMILDRSWSAGVEVLARKIETNVRGYDHVQFVAKVGYQF